MSREKVQKQIPNYIHPRNLEWCGIEPPSIKRTDVILGLYYNVLCPQERDAEARKKFYAWISAMDPSAAFPLNNDELFLCSPSTCKGIANKAFYGQLANKIRTYLETGLSFDITLEKSLWSLENELSSIYIKMGGLFRQREIQEQLPSLKARYRMLADSFEKCGDDPKKALSYAIQKYQNVKDDEEKLSDLLLGSIEKGSGQKLRELDYWNHRKNPLIKMINETLSAYPNSPFFLALQEVTPDSLTELENAFSKRDIHWVSFNNISGKKTTLLSPLNETVLGESGSHTATIGLSPELQIQRTNLGYLPNCSGTPRTILGIEVKNRDIDGSFAIFSTQTDYLIQEDLYSKTIEAIHLFIKEFTDNGTLPFIFGGDLNAFEGMKGAEYLDGLKSQNPLIHSIDYREGKFYSPKEIIDATFIGHHRDDYKMSFDEEGNVQPNALDHIFLTLEKIFGFRKAGVCDESGTLIDPIKEPLKFKKNLQERNTTSDHFMNGVLFISP